MRKLLLFVLLATGFSGYAQFNTISFSPTTFTADDAVTLTIDVTGTTLAGETELYMWTWSNKDANDPQYPGKDGFTNTAWDNAPATAKMIHVSGNIFSFTMTGSEMYSLAPGQLKHFQFLIKTKTGNKQSPDSPKYSFAPVNYVPSVYRLFPSRVSPDDAISIYFYQHLATDLLESRMTPVSITVTAYDMNDVQFGTPKVLPLKNWGQKLFSVSFIPTISWTVPAGKKLRRFTYIVNGTGFGTDGTPINIVGSLNERVFDDLH